MAKSEVEMILKKAHRIRHEGIDLENAGDLHGAELLYDKALSMYREHDKDDTLGYANAVRYPAVVKNLLGKREESAALWREALERYEKLGIVEGVAGAAGWLTIFAIERNDGADARFWFEKAIAASAKSDEAATHRFIDDVRKRLENFSASE